MDAGNMLKPMLARGELHCIGATTLDEYRKHIEKDAALERRFQPVLVERADRRGHDLHPARPARALRGAPRRAHPGRRARRRGHALRTATSPTASCPTRRSTWSTRRARRIRTEIDSMPSRARRGDAARACSSRSRRRRWRRRTTRRRRPGSRSCSRSWPSCASRRDGLRAQWEPEKDAIDALQGAAQEIEQVTKRDRDGRARLRPRTGPRSSSTATCPSCRRSSPPRGERSPEQAGGKRLLREEVDRGGDRRGRRALDRHPGHEAGRGREEKLLQLDVDLHQRVIGQDEAVRAWPTRSCARAPGSRTRAARSARSSSSGPTGVGKTELAKALAEHALRLARTRWSASTCPSTWRSTPSRA